MLPVMRAATPQQSYAVVSFLEGSLHVTDHYIAAPHRQPDTAASIARNMRHLMHTNRHYRHVFCATPTPHGRNIADMT
jgi:hypothetical protein